MPLYTMPMCLVIGSTLWTLCSSYKIDFCFFSVARTTPLDAENKKNTIISILTKIKFVKFCRKLMHGIIFPCWIKKQPHCPHYLLFDFNKSNQFCSRAHVLLCSPGLYTFDANRRCSGCDSCQGIFNLDKFTRRAAGRNT